MNCAFWMIDQLIRQGVTRFCIAPGSRSTPLVVAIAEHPLSKSLVHYDERGIGFYALGYGKGAKFPAVVVTTSGTAVGNLLPSVMEAHHSETPLILLTADRPVELRDCGANQATDQVKIFSSFVRWQIDLPPHLPENGLRSIIAQGIAYATQNSPGPVQINCQFREPLYAPQSYPHNLPHSTERDSKAEKSIFESRSAYTPSLWPSLPPPARLIPSPTQISAKRGVILLGETDGDPRPVLELGARLQWPIFADILSNARLYPTSEQIRHFDWILKSGAHPQADFILHFGKRFVSKKVLDWTPDLHVSPSPFLQDPSRSLCSRLQCDVASFCMTFESTSHADPTWLSDWKTKDAQFDLLSEALFKLPSPLTEAHAMRKLSEMLRGNTAVFLANGMPIRDADHFLYPKQCLGFFGNRGLSGIDGNIATAAGLSDGLNAPVIAFLGDQTCLHDLNSLPLLKNSSHPVIVIASNNFGSGIFSHLPISEWPLFETYMAAVHSWRFEDAAKMFGIHYQSEHNPSLTHTSLIEWITDREENFRFQKQFMNYSLLLG